MYKSITLKPRVSEKSYGLSEKLNVFVFEVPKSANKLTIAKAVSAQFDVTVTNVNISNAKGKSKRTIVKRSRPIAGRESDVKKAYVTVREGDSIPVFKSVDEPESKPASKGKK